MVRLPREAIECFLRTGMDVLVVGNCQIDRHAPDFPEGMWAVENLKTELRVESRLGSRETKDESRGARKKRFTGWCPD